MKEERMETLSAHWTEFRLLSKDVISVKGQPLTAASKILQNYISPYDATVTKKLKDAGCSDWWSFKFG
jgi:Asp-tRNA(Asn)/Glu-tRNA(Gln) amidotransferase A subunit family amidase